MENDKIYEMALKIYEDMNKHFDKLDISLSKIKKDLDGVANKADNIMTSLCKIEGTMDNLKEYMELMITRLC